MNLFLYSAIDYMFANSISKIMLIELWYNGYLG